MIIQKKISMETIKEEIYKYLISNFITKILLFILYIYFLDQSNKILLSKNYRLSNLKVCVCTLGKNENLYIREFVEHYKSYGVDKIYLYDNNDIEGEKFYDVIGDYVENEFVEIVNWRGVKGTSTYYGIMDSCYQSYHDQYDWLIFYELDEFLYLKDYKNIKSYLISNKFYKCESIQLNWVHMSDNNQIFYKNETLSERFTEKGKNVDKNRFNKICFVKTIIRGHLKNINIMHNHLLSKNLNACNGFGRKSKIRGILSLNPDYEYNYILHYYTKSTQEFIEKINRGDLLRGNAKNIIDWAIEKYFYINKITLAKINYLQKYLGPDYNLSIYIEQLE